MSEIENVETVSETNEFEWLFYEITKERENYQKKFNDIF